MRKRILSGLLVLLLCIGVLPLSLMQPASASYYSSNNYQILWSGNVNLFPSIYQSRFMQNAYGNSLWSVEEGGTGVLYRYNGTDIEPILEANAYEAGYYNQGEVLFRNWGRVSEDGYFVVRIPGTENCYVADAVTGNAVTEPYGHIETNYIADGGWFVAFDLNWRTGNESKLYSCHITEPMKVEKLELDDMGADYFDGEIWSVDSASGEGKYYLADGTQVYSDYRGTAFNSGYVIAWDQNWYNRSSVILRADGEQAVVLPEGCHVDFETTVWKDHIVPVEWYDSVNTFYNDPIIQYYDVDGNFLFSSASVQKSGDFRNGYAPVETDNGFSVLNRNGEFVIPPGALESWLGNRMYFEASSNVTSTGLIWVQFTDYYNRTCVLVDLDGPENNEVTSQNSGSDSNHQKDTPAVEDPPVVADPNAVAAVSSNAGMENYIDYGRPYKSYLYQRSDGCFTRVEGLEGEGKVAVEVYSPDFQLLTASSVPMELPYFGFFLAGSQYNYLLFGQNNPDERDNAEVYRVVKYSKGWERLDELCLYGMNTYEPFNFGSAWMTESDGVLYVRTCHTMYQDGGGTHHQANVTFSVRESDMTLLDEFSDVWNPANGFVSHSFRQFILIDEDGTIVAADHGDAAPRDLALMIYPKKAREGKFISDGVRGASFCNLTPEGQTQTGASLGGLAISDSHYLAAFSIDNQIGDVGRAGRNIKVGAIVKRQLPELTYGGTLRGPDSTTTLTDYETYGDLSASTPFLIELDDDRYLVLWEGVEKVNQYGWMENFSTGNIGYAYVDGTGRQIGQTRKTAGLLSDCQPIATADGKVVWYVTEDNSMPQFYILSENGLRTVRVLPDEPQFIDVHEGDWEYPYVQRAYANGAVGGIGNSAYGPGGKVTLAQFATMLGNVAYSDEVASKAQENWYNRQVEALQAHGIFQGVEDAEDLTAPATRYQMAQMVYNLLLDLNETLPSQADLQEVQSNILDWDSVPQGYRTAVNVCYALKIFNGVPDVGFAGDRTVTRDVMATSYCNMADAMSSI